MIANTPKPPYYAVIFSSIKTEENNGYSEMADLMIELANQQEEFLGVESSNDKLDITVSFWKDLESIKQWKQHSEHLVAQKKGKSDWYKKYKTRIARVEKDYDFEK